MLLSEFLKDGVASLESLYPTAEAKAVVLQLCSEILGTKNYTHIIEPQYQIDKKKVQHPQPVPRPVQDAPVP